MITFDNLQYQYIPKNYRQTIQSLLQQLCNHSFETYEHCIDVGNITLALSASLKLNKKDVCKLYVAALLHDIGKLAIDANLLAARNITPEQREYIRYTHIEATRTILSGKLADDIVTIAYHHHEKLDGSGYPNHLHGNQLSYLDQILMVADHTSAILMDRTYKKGKTKEECIQILTDMAAAGQVESTITDKMIGILLTHNLDWYNENKNQHKNISA